MRSARKYLIFVLTGLVLGAGSFFSQTGAEKFGWPAFFEEIYHLPSPTGYEEAMVKKIQAVLGEKGRFSRDNLGSLYFSAGPDSAQIAIISPLDESGYVISGWERNGYLRVDRVTPAPHPFWDSFPAGHPVEILTSRGVVEGVWAVPSLHIFPRERRGELNPPFNLEKAYIDIGAQSIEEIKSRGIQRLDPVLMKHRLVKLAGGQLAGPYLGGKACLASGLAAALDYLTMPQKNGSGVVFAWVAQSKFLTRGYRRRSSLGTFRAAQVLASPQVILVWPLPEGAPELPGIEIKRGPVLWTSSPALESKIRRAASQRNIPLQVLKEFSSAFLRPFKESHREVAVLGLPVRFLDTPSEVITRKDWQALTALLQGLTHSGGRP